MTRETIKRSRRHLFFEMLLLTLGTLLHVLRMLASESQKLILSTSDVTSAKVITDGEPTVPSLLVIKFFVTTHPVLHTNDFFMTPCLIIGMMFHVPKVLAVASRFQKLIPCTSGIVHAKVITTGEPTTPHLLVTNFPSINIFSAGDSPHVLCKSVDLDGLLCMQLVASQCTLHKLVDCVSLIMAMTMSTSFISGL